MRIEVATDRLEVRITVAAAELARDQLAAPRRHQLAFATQPSSAAAPGFAFASQPVVSVEDSLGNVVDTDSTTGVTLGLMGGDSTAALTCTSAPATVTNGVATFGGCSIDKGSPTTYQLTVASTSPTLGPLSSTQVTVS